MRVRHIEMYDIRTNQKLQNDRTGHDRADSEKHQRPALSGKERPIHREHIDRFGSHAKERDVSEREIQGKNSGSPHQLLLEMHMPFRACDRG